MLRTLCSPGMDVEVIRSARRRKTVQARQVDGVVRLSIPATMSPQDERYWVEEMTRRLERRARAARVDVAARAEVLARRYRLPRPASVRWVDNQTARWGSCTPADGAIRISTRLAAFPPWVLDYVLVHELAHLLVPDHSAAFWDLVGAYPKAERARGYLIAKGLEPDG
jgi:predicted metal-dependent hydrolase